MDDQYRGKDDPNCSHTKIMTELRGSRSNGVRDMNVAEVWI